MSVALVSDLHANLEALRALEKDLRAQRVDEILCLGDVIGYGANPRECLQWAMERCRINVLGNHEQAAMYYPEGFNPKARAALEWTRAQLNDGEAPREENWKLWGFLGNLPTRVEEGDTLYCHGSPRDPLREYVLPRDARIPEKIEAIFAAIPGTLAFIGHSHVPGVFLEDGTFLSPRSLEGPYRVPRDRKVLVNVGSVGQPRDGDPRLGYALFDGEAVTFRRVPYDCEAAAARIRSTGALPDFLASRLLVGK